MLGSHLHSHWLVCNLKIPVDSHVSIACISRQAHCTQSSHSCKYQIKDTRLLQEHRKLGSHAIVMKVLRGYASFAGHLTKALMLLQEARKA